MTKRVRIENADTSEYRIVVQIWEKSVLNGEPDSLVREVPLDYPTAMTDDDVYVTHTRYLVVRRA